MIGTTYTLKFYGQPYAASSASLPEPRAKPRLQTRAQHSEWSFQGRQLRIAEISKAVTNI
jgi:hypothetical protein